MDTNYKGHVISSWVSKSPDNDTWSVKLVISWSEGDAVKVQQLGSKVGFRSELEAESWGKQCGIKWIDDGKPDLRE